MITEKEVKTIVDRLFECEEGQGVEFGEVRLVSQDWLGRYLDYDDVKKVFQAYYKRVDEEEEKHCEEVFKQLKKDIQKSQDEDLKREVDEE